MTFAIRLDPDQAQQNARPDLEPMYLTFRWYFFEKVDFEKRNQQTKKNMKKFPGGKELIAIAITTLIWAAVFGGLRTTQAQTSLRIRAV